MQIEIVLYRYLIHHFFPVVTQLTFLRGASYKTKGGKLSNLVGAWPPSKKIRGGICPPCPHGSVATDTVSYIQQCHIIHSLLTIKQPYTWWKCGSIWSPTWSNLVPTWSNLVSTWSNLVHIVSKCYHIVSGCYHIVSKCYHIVSKCYHIVSKCYHLVPTWSQVLGIHLKNFQFFEFYNAKSPISNTGGGTL